MASIFYPNYANVYIRSVPFTTLIEQTITAGPGFVFYLTGSTFATASISASYAGTASLCNTSISCSYALSASYAGNVPLTSSYALTALTSVTSTSTSFIPNATFIGAANGGYLGGNASSSRLLAPDGVTRIELDSIPSTKVLLATGGGNTLTVQDSDNTIQINTDVHVSGDVYSTNFRGLATSASYALSASYSPGGGGAVITSGSTWNLTASWANTASTVANPVYTTLTTSSLNWITMSMAIPEQFVTFGTGSVIYNFTASNLPSASTVAYATLYISSSNTTTSSLSFPSNWVFMGYVPSSLSASRAAILSLKAFGTSTIVAAFAVQY